METGDHLQRLLQILRENLVVVVLAGIGLLFLGYGLIGFLRPQAPSEDIVIDVENDGEQIASTVTVDVSGAVNKPGVYSLASNSRVNDAIIQAGGLSDQANHEVVSRTINFAKTLSDGEKIYIPYVGENSQTDVLASQTGQTSINTASSKELEDLPGIGPVTAQKIIDGRPYSSVDNLLTKKVVGNSVFEKIKEQISL